MRWRAIAALARWFKRAPESVDLSGLQLQRHVVGDQVWVWPKRPALSVLGLLAVAGTQDELEAALHARHPSWLASAGTASHPQAHSPLALAAARGDEHVAARVHSAVAGALEPFPATATVKDMVAAVVHRRADLAELLVGPGVRRAGPHLRQGPESGASRVEAAANRVLAAAIAHDDVSAVRLAMSLGANPLLRPLTSAADSALGLSNSTGRGLAVAEVLRTVPLATFQPAQAAAACRHAVRCGMYAVGDALHRSGATWDVYLAADAAPYATADITLPSPSAAQRLRMLWVFMQSAPLPRRGSFSALCARLLPDAVESGTAEYIGALLEAATSGPQGHTAAAAALTTPRPSKGRGSPLQVAAEMHRWRVVTLCRCWLAWGRRRAAVVAACDD
jgi:hypothetical protein